MSWCQKDFAAFLSDASTYRLKIISGPLSKTWLFSIPLALAHHPIMIHRFPWKVTYLKMECILANRRTHLRAQYLKLKENKW